MLSFSRLRYPGWAITPSHAVQKQLQQQTATVAVVAVIVIAFAIR